MKIPFTVMILIFLIYFSILGVVHTYSFSAFNAMTGQNVLTVTPGAYFDFRPSISAKGELVLSYGFSENIDLFVGALYADIIPNFHYQSSWIMPRIDLGGSQILAILFRFNYSNSIQWNIAPQYHVFLDNDHFAFELNLSADIPLDSVYLPVISAVIAPVWKTIPNILHLYLEINPSHDFSTASNPFNLNLIPGVYLSIPDSPHSLCIGVPFNSVTYGVLDFGLNMWYSLVFDLKP